MAAIKPFSALYVLILASLGPLVTKESGRIYSLLDKVFKWSAKERAKREKEVDSIKRLHELHAASLYSVAVVVLSVSRYILIIADIFRESPIYLNNR